MCRLFILYKPFVTCLRTCTGNTRVIILNITSTGVPTSRSVQMSGALAATILVWTSAPSTGSRSNQLLEVGADYSIKVGGLLWLQSGPIGIAANNGAWISSSTGVDATTPLVPAGGQTTATGVDKLGSFSRSAQRWVAGEGGEAVLETAVRTYIGDATAVFETVFLAGCTNCSIGRRNDLVSAFPTFTDERRATTTKASAP